MREPDLKLFRDMLNAFTFTASSWRLEGSNDHKSDSQETTLLKQRHPNGQCFKLQSISSSLLGHCGMPSQISVLCKQITPIPLHAYKPVHV